MSKHLRSSPAVLVAVLALVAALGGTAIAGSTVTAAKKKKTTHADAKQDKALFKSELAKAAPTLSVAKAVNATNATHATSADTATTAGSAQPAAFAFVHPTLTGVTVSNAKGVTNANVNRVNPGVICIKNLAFPIKGAQITTQFGGTGGETGQFSVGNTGNCPQGGQILIWNAAGTSDVDVDFYILLYG